MKRRSITIFVNDDEYTLEVPVNRTLLQVLREDLNLVGTKYGCGTGECGACTVLMDGNKAVLACLALAATMNGKKFTTIEGMEKDGVLDPVQQAFIDKHATQCGYCTPGMVLKSKSLLSKNPRPSEEEIRAYLEGNICRCTGYVKIVDAVKHAGELLADQAVE
jgi:carbon-monoxide dehydrogenase small subunit